MSYLCSPCGQVSNSEVGIAPGFFCKWEFDAKRSDLREPLLVAQQMTWVYRNAIKSAIKSFLEFARDAETDAIALTKTYQLKDGEGKSDNIVRIEFYARTLRFFVLVSHGMH